MLSPLRKKTLQALVSVLPVVVVVLIIYSTPFVSLTRTELVTFLVCSLALIIGIALFNQGADMAMMNIGQYMGSSLTKQKNVPLLLLFALFMGIFVTVAEPDLSVLAGQVGSVINNYALIFGVGAGVGVFLLLGMVKILFRKDLAPILLFLYFVLFAVAAVLMEGNKSTYLPMAFDSGGVTTGPITVPFIMSLGIGVAATVGGKNSSENSFGLIALCSVGPVAAVLLLSLGTTGTLCYSLPDYSVASHLGVNFGGTVVNVIIDVLKALSLIVIFFIILQIAIMHLPRGKVKEITVGLIYTFVGMVLFLAAVTIGFMPVGYKIGTCIASNRPLLIGFGVVLGMLIVLAEPAVHVLNKQVETITGGTVSKRSMVIALSLGVGISIGLSIIRIIYGFSILYYLIPGYIISLGLSFFVPKIYTSIAFDAGGVASGPLTSGFILPLIIGVSFSLRGEQSVLEYGFGVVAMVAMTPLITIQVLGFRALAASLLRRRIALKRIYKADDEQIIEFM
jgi:hypothetical protein